jgi:hypothetical protein
MTDPAMQGFYKVWDEFYAAVGYANVAVGITNLGVGGYKWFARGGAIKSWNKFTGYCKNFQGQLSFQARGAWNNIKSLFVSPVSIGTVPRELILSRLPGEFVNALRAFKTDNEIIDFFFEIQNIRSGTRFFTDMDYYMSNFNFANLTKAEVVAIAGYTSKHYFSLFNGWLRAGTNLAETGPMKALLNNALAKLTTHHEGIIYRGLKIDPLELNAFLANHGINAIKTWDDFASCGGSLGASFAGKEAVNVIFKISHTTGKNISELADGVMYGGMQAPEIMLKSGCKMKVTSAPYTNPGYPGKLIIDVQQVF